jgi:hypothetical protein
MLIVANTLLLTAPVRCPEGHEHISTWDKGVGVEQEQTCPECSAIWSAAWPGWEFQPRVVVADREPCETVTTILSAVTVKR